MLGTTNRYIKFKKQLDSFLLATSKGNANAAADWHRGIVNSNYVVKTSDGTTEYKPFLNNCNPQSGTLAEYQKNYEQWIDILYAGDKKVVDRKKEIASICAQKQYKGLDVVNTVDSDIKAVVDFLEFVRGNIHQGGALLGITSAFCFLSNDSYHNKFNIQEESRIPPSFIIFEGSHVTMLLTSIANHCILVRGGEKIRVDIEPPIEVQASVDLHYDGSLKNPQLLYLGKARIGSEIHRVAEALLRDRGEFIVDGVESDFSKSIGNIIDNVIQSAQDKEASPSVVMQLVKRLRQFKQKILRSSVVNSGGVFKRSMSDKLHHLKKKLEDTCLTIKFRDPTKDYTNLVEEICDKLKTINESNVDAVIKEVTDLSSVTLSSDMIEFFEALKHFQGLQVADISRLRDGAQNASNLLSALNEQRFLKSKSDLHEVTNDIRSFVDQINKNKMRDDKRLPVAENTVEINNNLLSDERIEIWDEAVIKPYLSRVNVILKNKYDTLVNDVKALINNRSVVGVDNTDGYYVETLKELKDMDRSVQTKGELDSLYSIFGGKINSILQKFKEESAEKFNSTDDEKVTQDYYAELQKLLDEYRFSILQVSDGSEELYEGLRSFLQPDDLSRNVNGVFSIDHSLETSNNHSQDVNSVQYDRDAAELSSVKPDDLSRNVTGVSSVDHSLETSNNHSQDVNAVQYDRDAAEPSSVKKRSVVVYWLAALMLSVVLTTVVLLNKLGVIRGDFIQRDSVVSTVICALLVGIVLTLSAVCVYHCYKDNSKKSDPNKGYIDSSEVIVNSQSFNHVGSGKAVLEPQGLGHNVGLDNLNSNIEGDTERPTELSRSKSLPNLSTLKNDAGDDSGVSHGGKGSSSNNKQSSVNNGPHVSKIINGGKGIGR